MSIYEIIEQRTGIPVVYSHFKKAGSVPKEPPYFAVMGAGQSNFKADSTYYYSRNLLRLEYYFAKKNSTMEATIEEILLDNGLLYTKSEDVYIEEEGVFVIYYEF